MNLSDDAKVGLALLEDVEQAILDNYGGLCALSAGSDYDPRNDSDNKELQSQVDAAERKLGDLPQGLAYASFLRGRLLAIKQAPMSNRAMLKCAEHYGRAIELGYDEARVRYFWGLHEAAWNNRDKAVGQFQKVVDLAGVDSDLGLEAAKELEKVKIARKSGCLSIIAVLGLVVVAALALIIRF